MATTTAVMGGVCNTGTAAAAVASSSQQKVTGTGCQSLFWGTKSGSARFVKAAVSTSGRATMPVVEASRVDRYSKDDIIVSPSILSANFARLGEQVSILSAHCSLFLN
jgi:ribulose-phosphate 3-epimerase